MPASCSRPCKRVRRRRSPRSRQTIAAHPEAVEPLGLRYLEAHLLELAGRPQLAIRAFVSVLSDHSRLGDQSRFRIGSAGSTMHHPEGRSGSAGDASRRRSAAELAVPAADLLRQTIAAGGDCRLLDSLSLTALPAPQRRGLELQQADCALRRGARELAAPRLMALLREDTADEPARRGGPTAAQLGTEHADRGTLVRLGAALHHQRQLEAAIARIREAARSLPTRLHGSDEVDTLYLLARGEESRGAWAEAAERFTALADRTADPVAHGQAPYQAGIDWELAGRPVARPQSYVSAANDGRETRFAAPALLAAIRLYWIDGRQAEALRVLRPVALPPTMGSPRLRASLFLASSQLAAGKRRRRPLPAGGGTRRRRRHARDPLLAGTPCRARGNVRPRRQPNTSACCARRPFIPLGRDAALRVHSASLQTAAIARAHTLVDGARSKTGSTHGCSRHASDRSTNAPRSTCIRR